MIGFCLFAYEMKAQDIHPVPIDSLPNAGGSSTLLLKGDSVYLAVDTAGFRPKPMRAVLLSAIFPGLGQIYNRKYWQLPIVYGAFLGCAYAITWNNTQYTGYRTAFIDFNKDPENTDSWRAYASPSYPADINKWTAQQKTQFSSRLKTQKDYYRYYRDMSVFITVAVYGLQIVDAYVDAQLFDFDVSPNLSMRAAPVLFEKTLANSRSLGLQLSFTF